MTIWDELEELAVLHKEINWAHTIRVVAEAIRRGRELEEQVKADKP